MYEKGKIKAIFRQEFREYRLHWSFQDPFTFRAFLLTRNDLSLLPRRENRDQEKRKRERCFFWTEGFVETAEESVSYRAVFRKTKANTIDDTCPTYANVL